jgi:hypothetical protein
VAGLRALVQQGVRQQLWLVHQLLQGWRQRHPNQRRSLGLMWRPQLLQRQHQLSRQQYQQYPKHCPR